tara:strand:- start:2651 stop:2884 length:234 start_codon:yes stop_codon:yes gene_type:complete
MTQEYNVKLKLANDFVIKVKANNKKEAYYSAWNQLEIAQKHLSNSLATADKILTSVINNYKKVDFEEIEEDITEANK